MKIINQTTDEMTLKDGNISAIILGSIFTILGLVLLLKIISPNSGSGSIAMLVGSIFLVSGLLSIILSSSISVDIKKTTGQISYQTKRLIGGKLTNYDI